VFWGGRPRAPRGAGNALHYPGAPSERFRDGATGREKLARAGRGLAGGPAAAAIRLPMACGGSRGERTGQVRSKCSTGTPRAAAIFCKVA
jgi:hypothetical protein